MNEEDISQFINAFEKYSFSSSMDRGRMLYQEVL